MKKKVKQVNQKNKKDIEELLPKSRETLFVQLNPVKNNMGLYNN